MHDAVHTTKFGGTHIARLLLMLPFVLSAFMPALQRLYILHPPTFSSPISLFDTGVGADLHALTYVMGILTLLWSQMLEARRRQKLAREEAGTAKDARSIKAWSRFDCVEAACFCVTGAVGFLLTKIDMTLAYRIAFAIACLPGPLLTSLIRVCNNSVTFDHHSGLTIVRACPKRHINRSPLRHVYP